MGDSVIQEIKMIKYLLPKTQNPLIKDNLVNRINSWLCGKNFKNCIKTGSYYGMAQSRCIRCGHKNRYIAADFVPEWSIPD